MLIMEHKGMNLQEQIEQESGRMTADWSCQCSVGSQKADEQVGTDFAEQRKLMPLDCKRQRKQEGTICSTATLGVGRRWRNAFQIMKENDH